MNNAISNSFKRISSPKSSKKKIDASNKNLNPEDKLETLKTLLKNQNIVCDDELLIMQFLRATGYDVQKSAQRLKATLAWREKEKPQKKVCAACLQIPRSHYMHVTGFSKQGMPVIYSCIALAKNKDIQNNRDHMLSTFEQAIRMMPAGTDQWIWICDFHGFGIRDCDPRLARIFLDVAGNHYPERLHVFITVNTPTIFNMFYRFDAGKPNSKNNLNLRKELGQLLDPSYVDWFMKEFDQNQTKKAIKEKSYPYGPRYQDVTLHEGHDPRGQPDLVQLIKEHPEYLVPKRD